MILRLWLSRSSSGVVALELEQLVVGLGAVVDLEGDRRAAPVVGPTIVPPELSRPSTSPTIAFWRSSGALESMSSIRS